MTKKERNEVIKAMENEIKTQLPIIVESVKCDTLTEKELFYLKNGVELGLKTAIDILREERYQYGNIFNDDFVAYHR